ncbi:MAG: type II toxin-antitoxin system VapC family toxin [Bacteroidota bacterium]|nr:type II toxin-antitoxin system VapC family toxin [Bacteroidota bacterium]
MNLLLDTHTLIWFLNGDGKLSDRVKTAIEDPNNSRIVSIASIWEIAIKISLDKFRFQKGFKCFLDMVEENGFEILPVTFEHAMVVSTLEFIHRDPFDRLLIAQCKADKLILATKDENIKRYNIQTIW